MRENNIKNEKTNNMNNQVNDAENQEITELDVNHLMQIRKEKLDKLIEEGKNPYEITKFNRTHISKEWIIMQN